MSVGLVLVSHSKDIAAGTAALAGQMAPDVRIVPAGGQDDGSIGTSFDLITSAIEKASDGRGVVVLYDLGSALMTTETAIEFLDPEVAGTVRVVDAPLVEGALAAAVTAQGGAELDQVVASARDSGQTWAQNEPNEGTSPAQDPAGPDSPSAHRVVTLTNPLGLHARPAGALVRAVDRLEATVTVGRPGEPAAALAALLRVVALALRGGEQVEITAEGPDAEQALTVVSDLIEEGFGEAPAGGRIAPQAMGTVRARMGNAAPVRRGLKPRIEDGLLRAVPGAPGLAVGELRRLDRTPASVGPGRAFDGSDRMDAAAIDHERQLLVSALRVAGRKLAGGNEFQAAHATLLADPELLEDAQGRLGAGSAGAAQAWWATIQQRAEELAVDSDELVAARAVDVREAGSAVLAELGVSVERIPAKLAGAIVFADDLGPGEVPVLVERGAAGVVLSRSSVTAHAVIVARGLGLPAVLQAGDDLAKVAAGAVLVLDGGAGTVRVSPPADEVERVRDQIAEQATTAARRIEAAREPVVLADGRRIDVVANIGSLADARAAMASGADGVGLLRTELLVLDRETLPDEDTQVRDLAEILDVLGGLPVVVRVLDAGGDKPVTALNLDAQHNGFLGLRGLRYLLTHPEVLRTQLRAIMRASVGHRVSVMAPMVSVASEVERFRAAVDEAAESLVADGVDHQRPDQVGVMVEVPAAALAADEICRVSDFISVGTNDLTSYTMAADRTVTEVLDLLDPSATAVQRLLDQLCAQAMAAGVPVAVCGEMAGMTDFAAGLVARGVHELSMAPARIPVIKELLRATA